MTDHPPTANTLRTREERVILAPTGSRITAKSWLTGAPPIIILVSGRVDFKRSTTVSMLSMVVVMRVEKAAISGLSD